MLGLRKESNGHANILKDVKVYIGDVEQRTYTGVNVRYQSLFVCLISTASARRHILCIRCLGQAPFF